MPALISVFKMSLCVTIGFLLQKFQEGVRICVWHARALPAAPEIASSESSSTPSMRMAPRERNGKSVQIRSRLSPFLRDCRRRCNSNSLQGRNGCVRCGLAHRKCLNPFAHKIPEILDWFKPCTLAISSRFQPAILNLMISASVFGQYVENLRGVQSPNRRFLSATPLTALPKSAAISAIALSSSTSCLRRAISMSVHFTQLFVRFTCRFPSSIAQVAVVVDDAVEVANRRPELRVLASLLTLDFAAVILGASKESFLSSTGVSPGFIRTRDRIAMKFIRVSTALR